MKMSWEINKIIYTKVSIIKSNINNTFNNSDARQYREQFFESPDLFRWNLYMSSIQKLTTIYGD